MKSEVGNRIDFSNEVMLNRKRNKGETRLHYKLMKYKKMGEYKILQDTDTFRTFQVPIGNAKVLKSFVFHKDAPILSYFQK